MGMGTAWWEWEGIKTPHFPIYHPQVADHQTLLMSFVIWSGYLREWLREGIWITNGNGKLMGIKLGWTWNREWESSKPLGMVRNGIENDIPAHLYSALIARCHCEVSCVKGVRSPKGIKPPPLAENFLVLLSRSAWYIVDILMHFWCIVRITAGYWAEPAQTTPTGRLAGVKRPHHGVKRVPLVVKGLKGIKCRCNRRVTEESLGKGVHIDRSWDY